MPDPVSMLLRVAEDNGAHATVSVWVGRQYGARGRAGSLILRSDEAAELAALLDAAPPEGLDGHDDVDALIDARFADLPEVAEWLKRCDSWMLRTEFQSQDPYRPGGPAAIID